MLVQFIDTPAGRMAVLPEADYQRMVDVADDAEAGAIIDRFRERLVSGDEKLVPAGVVGRVLAGDNPVRVWREHRGMKVGDLASAAGLSQAYISQIEAGKRDGSVGAIRAIATALNVTIDDIVG
ncbi:MAG: helix-turn-helix transcriptional regulator [Alphaproteobacteria bacterium]|nr:helix-turn-helix transcriptional regulator [Alphaproteobacteria bacterium]